MILLNQKKETRSFSKQIEVKVQEKSDCERNIILIAPRIFLMFTNANELPRK